MALEERTYTLPPEALRQFEREVPAAQRSSVIAALIQDWLARRQRKALRSEIVQGCREMADEYLRLEEEFHPLEEEVEREFATGSSPR
jgi:metal-responsive CopG/Arc/MetJ family transcriptional regulator